MKKYLFGALALPLLFACSSEDFNEQEVISNDRFAGIEKVDATFTMDDGAITRYATDWGAQVNDRLGFAWLGDGTVITNAHANWGSAFQNHPLTLKQVDGVYKFVPETSIYVGKYYVYYPYDETVVGVKAINFKSLEKQTITDGQGGTSWAAVAKNSINIGDKWTEVTETGTTISGTTWEKAGIKQNYHLYAATFSNQTGLDMTYVKNNVKFDGTKAITGATDIAFTPAADTEVGAADIYNGTVELTGAANSFTYAPTQEPVAGGAHNSEFWADKKNLNTTITGAGFTFTNEPIALDAVTKEAETGISTKDKTNGWIWFNSLPVTDGSGAAATNVTTKLTTSYGVVTVTKALSECAYAYEATSTGARKQWIKLGTASTTPLVWDPAAHKTFINYYGDHKGKYAFDVDFSKGDMNNMHIINDRHLQKALKYIIASNKAITSDITLLLDKDAANEFKISKISIALLQTINRGATYKVLVKACDKDANGLTSSEHTPDKIVVTQADQEGDLANKKEVPALNRVFAVATKVYLASGTDWTWSGGGETAGWDDAITVDDKVSSITNEGTLTVNAINVELDKEDATLSTATLNNAKDATMNITKVTTVKNALTNLGTINVGDNTEDGKKAELRAYNVEITNDAKDKLMPADLIAATVPATAEVGLINNYGVVGVSDIGSSGKFNNYGLIDVKDAGAITLLTTNQVVTDFDNAFNATDNKMGTVNLPSPTALVSVNNKAANGFILYNWPAATPTYVTPEGNVKYNTIVVSGNIEFTENETEIQYLMFNGERTQVINPGGYLTQLKGVIVNAGKSIIIEKDNKLNPMSGTFLGAGATVYKGGQFTHNAKVVGTTASNYFGDWETTQIVKF